MARMVKCIKLSKELPGLEDAPWPDELGDRIWENVSEEGWKLWLEHQKMLLNEYRLNPSTPEAYESCTRPAKTSSTARERSCRRTTCRRKPSDLRPRGPANP